MTLSAIHNGLVFGCLFGVVVCDIGGYDFVSYSQLEIAAFLASTSCL